MCQFPRLPFSAYVFSTERRRITGVGFSHSEIRGSKAVQRLTAAYRSRPRPSSTPDAKASTVCPSYLDGDQSRTRGARPVIPVYVGSLLCSFQGPWRGDAPRSGAGTVPDAPAAAGLSKLDSTRGTAKGPAPHPVDVLGAGAIEERRRHQRCSLERR